jgi:CubicO group peptidase (beta-lactamase class C family)
MLRFVPLVLALTLLTPQAPAPIDFSGLDAIARKELQDTMTPGAAIAVIQGDRVLLARGFGVANVETGEAVRPEMVFRLGSTTKMFTAATVVLLAQQGKLNLDEPIGKHITGLTPRLAAITANQLLSHTAGILDEAPMFGSHDDEALKREVAGWKDDRFFTQAGKVYSYSNPGYWLAGLLAETIGGTPYADQVATTIFEPLGMTHSTFRPTIALTFPLAQGHDVFAGKQAIIRPAADNAASWPAGSIYTSVMDLSRWMIAFVNGGEIGGVQALPASVFATLSTPHATIPGSTNQYGYGVQVGTWRGLDMVEHSGSRSGYGSIIRMVPSRKFGVVVLANRSSVSLTRTANAAIEAVFTLAPAPVEAPKVVLTMTPAEAARIAGVYSQGARQIELVAHDAALFVKVAARETAIEKVAENELMIGTARYFMVRGSSGVVEYLHAGGRSWARVQSPARPAKPIFENAQAQIVPAFDDPASWIHQL